MATLFERYNNASDATGDQTSNGVRWDAQTFTPSIGHTITSVKLYMRKDGSPGTMTVSIKAVDGNGKPTGSDLASGTTDADTLPSSPAAREWREITFTTGATLTVDTQYAIVVKCPSGSTSNWSRWGSDQTSPTYAGGTHYNSSDSGGSWTTSNADALFEEYGDLVSTASPTVTIQATTAVTATTATGNGNVTSLGVPTATQHGHVWANHTNPTTSDSKTEKGVPSATGAYTSSLTGLLPNVSYYARAYIINSLGTFYSSQLAYFVTSGGVPEMTTDFVPSSVKLSPVSGVGDVSQTIPCAVMVLPPPLSIEPFPNAVMVATSVTRLVVISGTPPDVTKNDSLEE